MTSEKTTLRGKLSQVIGLPPLPHFLFLHDSLFSPLFMSPLASFFLFTIFFSYFAKEDIKHKNYVNKFNLLWSRTRYEKRMKKKKKEKNPCNNEKRFSALICVCVCAYAGIK